MSAAKQKKEQDPNEKLIATNPNGMNKYFISDSLEAGIALTGTEVKSLRTISPQLKDAHVEIRPYNKHFEAWLLNMHISPYSHGNIWNHLTTRPRRLLLHRREIDRLWGASIQDGYTIVPLRLYFKKGRVKVQIGLGKGKKKFDKREDLKKKTADREIDQAMKAKNRRGD